MKTDSKQKKSTHEKHFPEELLFSYICQDKGIPTNEATLSDFYANAAHMLAMHVQSQHPRVSMKSIRINTLDFVCELGKMAGSQRYNVGRRLHTICADEDEYNVALRPIAEQRIIHGNTIADILLSGVQNDRRLTLGGRTQQVLERPYRTDPYESAHAVEHAFTRESDHTKRLM